MASGGTDVKARLGLRPCQSRPWISLNVLMSVIVRAACVLQIVFLQEETLLDTTEDKIR